MAAGEKEGKEEKREKNKREQNYFSGKWKRIFSKRQQHSWLEARYIFTANEINIVGRMCVVIHKSWLLLFLSLAPGFHATTFSWATTTTAQKSSTPVPPNPTHVNDVQG